MEIEVRDIIDPLLSQIEKECDDLKEFIGTKDFPYHKQYYYNRIVRHASAMLLLAGEIKALHSLQDHRIESDEYSESNEDLVHRLSDCRIDV